MTGLVLGGAACLWEDLAALGEWRPDVVLAVNNAGVDYTGRVDHWVSLHPEKWRRDPDHRMEIGWSEQRRLAGGNMDFRTWTHEHKMALADGWIAGWTNGSSGLTAVGVALEKIMVRAVVLAGVPMDPRAHYFDRRPWPAADDHWPNWLARTETLMGRVFSLSGRTRELLGAPPIDLIAPAHPVS